MKKEGLSVDVGGLQLRNPCLLASGIQGLTGASLKRVWEAGAGAVITKSVSREAREGYSGPRVVGTLCGLINSMGLPNPGIENILDEVETVKNVGATVLGSVFGGGGGGICNFDIEDGRGWCRRGRVKPFLSPRWRTFNCGPESGTYRRGG